MIGATTQLNRPGSALAQLPGVHAMTDVTGFGLLGHSLELAKGAGLSAHLQRQVLPWLPGVQALAAQGVVTGASGRNWAAYGAQVRLPADITPAEQALLTDPQTSGGLLVACSPDTAEQVLAVFAEQGFASASVIGHMEAGPAQVVVQ